MEINSLRIDKPITIEKMNDDGDWTEYFKCKSHVQTISSNENISSGAVQSNTETMFVVRYCKATSQIEFNTQCYRIKFRGAVFDITSCDNDKYENALIVMKGKGQLE